MSRAFFVLLAGLFTSPVLADSTVGYPSVAAALSDLKSQPDLQISVSEGWTSVVDKKRNHFWTFTPEGHPAHPAVVKRAVVERDGAIYVEMSALCQAEKTPCDTLVEQFREMNANLSKSMQQGGK